MTETTVKLWRTLTWPNRISIVRLLLVAPLVVLLMNQQNEANPAGWPWARHAALAVFAVMAVSDFLDGTLARKLNQRTRLGAILDPLADKALIIWSVVLLSIPGSAVPGARIHNWVVVAVVAKDLWVIVGFVVAYLVTDRFLIRPTMAGKLSTFGQLTMVIAVLLAPDLNELRPRLGSTVADVFEYLVMGLAAAAVVSYTRMGLLFIHEAQQPLESHSMQAKGTEEAK